MGRLIDEDDVLRMLCHELCHSGAICPDGYCEEIREKLKDVPDAQPKIGKWYRGEAYPHHLYCSVCFRTALPNDEYVERWNLHMNYCPNCGAKMEG